MLDNILQSFDGILKMRWKLAVILFLVGLCMHAVVFFRAHNEGDEVIYRTLTEQLDKGRGYTLQGSRLLENGLIDKAQYDKPLFFHPPGGVALYWVAHRLFGDAGYCLVPILSYALFFWSMIFLVKALNLTSSNMALALVAALSAFSPVMSHVTVKFWLDGPLLALSTLAVAMFAWAVCNNKTGWILASGMVLGYASLIKITAFLVIPGALLVGWCLMKTPDFRVYARQVLLLLATALVVQLPWEIWQWRVVGSPFPSWAGKPSQTLVESNRYVHFLTVVRSPWVYLKLTAAIMWTSIPSIFLLSLLWNNKQLRCLRLSLAVWVLTVLVFNIVLGFFGYSKVFRYAILMTPALIILFATLMDEAVFKFRNDSSTQASRAFAVGISISLLALLLEILTGINVMLFSRHDIIYPLIGGDWLMR